MGKKHKKPIDDVLNGNTGVCHTQEEYERAIRQMETVARMGNRHDTTIIQGNSGKSSESAPRDGQSEDGSTPI